MPILSSAGSNISIMVQMFPNKDGSSVDGKSFSDGGIFVVFPRTISLFLLRWSFFGFISVFKPITNLFLLFSEKKWDMYQPAIDFMKRGLKYYSSKQCLSFWDILRWLNSLWGWGIPMRWSCSFPRKLYGEKSKNNCCEEIHNFKWQRPITLSSTQKICTADLSHPQQRKFLWLIFYLIFDKGLYCRLCIKPKSNFFYEDIPAWAEVNMPDRQV